MPLMRYFSIRDVLAGVRGTAMGTCTPFGFMLGLSYNVFYSRMVMSRRCAGWHWPYEPEVWVETVGSAFYYFAFVFVM